MAGGLVGLAVSLVVLSLIWLGVAGVLFVGTVDLAGVFWPSFFMLTTTWHTTVPGFLITTFSGDQLLAVHGTSTRTTGGCTGWGKVCYKAHGAIVSSIEQAEDL
jgi:hypothetical protein